MPFPPNYRQDRNNRARAKAQRALEKQARREEKSNLRQRREHQSDAAAENDQTQQKVE
jgi:hypothetical protein